MSAKITNNAARNRYEIHLDGSLVGFAEYRLRDRVGRVGRVGQVVFTHVEIDPSFGGRGLGGELARGALDDVRAIGRTAVPLCPFLKAYIGKHGEYQDLLAPH